MNDFDPETWKISGYGLTTPDRLAFHILQSDKYYIGDNTPLKYSSGKEAAEASWTIDKKELPGQSDILYMTETISADTDHWLDLLDFDELNINYKWTGEKMGSVVLFLIRHSQYHLGEMSALLNQKLKGKAADHFVDTNNI